MEIIKDKSEYISKIENIITFKFLDRKEINEILNASSICIFENGEKIVTQGTIDRSFYAIIDGAVQVCVDNDKNTDEPVYISTIGCGEVFGEAGIFLRVKRTANVVSLGVSILLKIEREAMMQFIKHNPAAGNKILMIIIYSLLKKLKEANQELAYERKLDASQDDIDVLVHDFMIKE